MEYKKIPFLSQPSGWYGRRVLLLFQCQDTVLVIVVTHKYVKIKFWAQQSYHFPNIKLWSEPAALWLLGCTKYLYNNVTHFCLSWENINMQIATFYKIANRVFSGAGDICKVCSLSSPQAQTCTFCIWVFSKISNKGLPTLYIRELLPNPASYQTEKSLYVCHSPHLSFLGGLVRFFF